MNNETAFNMASSNIRYGPGASLEIGMDLADMGAENVMVVTDPNLAKLDFVSAILGALQEQSVPFKNDVFTPMSLYDKNAIIVLHHLGI